jgi:hypothetical protein
MTTSSSREDPVQLSFTPVIISLLHYISSPVLAAVTAHRLPPLISTFARMPIRRRNITFRVVLNCPGNSVDMSVNTVEIR